MSLLVKNSPFGIIIVNNILEDLSLKIISWNIDSLNAALTSDSNRAILTRETLKSIARMKPDFFCIQETKLNKLLPNQEKILMDMFPEYTISATYSTSKKGYAGTMTLSKCPTITVDSPQITDGKLDDIDNHGRITTTFNGDFYLVNVYTVNSGNKLINLDNRMIWDEAFANYVSKLSEDSPVIICGDLNVAHKSIDLKYPKGNERSPGYSKEERDGFSNLLNRGFTDVFREIYPDKTDYTWWNQVSKTAKSNNSGWRIDYFLIDNDTYGSNDYTIEVMDTGERADHAPLILTYDD